MRTVGVAMATASLAFWAGNALDISILSVLQLALFFAGAILIIGGENK